MRIFRIHVDMSAMADAKVFVMFGEQAEALALVCLDVAFAVAHDAAQTA